MLFYLHFKVWKWLRFDILFIDFLLSSPSTPGEILILCVWCYGKPAVHNTKLWWVTMAISLASYVIQLRSVEWRILWIKAGSLSCDLYTCGILYCSVVLVLFAYSSVTMDPLVQHGVFPRDWPEYAEVWSLLFHSVFLWVFFFFLLKVFIPDVGCECSCILHLRQSKCFS